MRVRLTVALAAASAAAAVMLVSGFRAADAPPATAAPAHHHAAASALPPALAAPDRSYRALLGRLGPCPGASAQVRAAARLRAAALRGASAAGPASVRARAATLRRARDLLVRARPRCAPKVVPPPQTTSPTRTTAPPQSSQVIDVGADPAGNLRFVQTSLTATAGAMTIRFTNPSGVPHNVGITGANASVGTTATVSNGGVVNLEANLPPGMYTLFCGVGQHAELGMSIPLIVT